MPALQELTAVVVRLFPEEGEGFLKTPHEQETHFHRYAVLQSDINCPIRGHREDWER
jgi:hypothetical protein